MIKVQTKNWRKIVRRLKMIDLRSNTHGCELIILKKAVPTQISMFKLNEMQKMS